MIEGNYIKEIYRATGGPWGRQKVDEIFENFLKSLFSSENIIMIKKDHGNRWLKVINEFQVLKRKLQSNNSDTTLSIKSFIKCPLDRQYF